MVLALLMLVASTARLMKIGLTLVTEYGKRFDINYQKPSKRVVPEKGKILAGSIYFCVAT
jgi:hypothetical protein